MEQISSYLITLNVGAGIALMCAMITGYGLVLEVASGDLSSLKDLRSMNWYQAVLVLVFLSSLGILFLRVA